MAESLTTALKSNGKHDHLRSVLCVLYIWCDNFRLQGVQIFSHGAENWINCDDSPAKYMYKDWSQMNEQFYYLNLCPKN